MRHKPILLPAPIYRSGEMIFSSVKIVASIFRGTMATIDRDTLDNIELAVPPLQEQVSIMNRLEGDRAALDAVSLNSDAQLPELSALALPRAIPSLQTGAGSSLPPSRPALIVIGGAAKPRSRNRG
jgi:hypothetical protein